MSSTKTESYKELRAKLDGLLEWFEQEGHDIDEAISKYEQAAKLIEKIEKHLETAENKVVQLRKDAA